MGSRVSGAYTGLNAGEGLRTGVDAKTDKRTGGSGVVKDRVVIEGSSTSPNVREEPHCSITQSIYSQSSPSQKRVFNTESLQE